MYVERLITVRLPLYLPVFSDFVLIDSLIAAMLLIICLLKEELPGLLLNKKTSLKTGRL